MLNDWWTAHRIEVFGDFVIVLATLIFAAAAILWPERKSKG